MSEGGREGVREGEREGEREGGREGEKEGGGGRERYIVQLLASNLYYTNVCW